MLVNGQWSETWQPVQKADATGRFERQTSTFRNWITPNGRPGPTGEGGFAAEAGRYRLFVALICPWASRTLAARALKGLEDVIPVTVLNPELTDQGWRFGAPGEDADADPLASATYMHELYTRADPQFTGRATVPVLWDMKQDRPVNNESADILRMFDTAFDGIVPPTPRLFPEDLAPAITSLNTEIYEHLNNGVYKAGFASSQRAYNEAVTDVFRMLDKLEARLSNTPDGPWLFGETLTESDIRLFVTLIRFDAAYHGLFKCNLRQIADYPNLSGLMERFYQLPGVAATVNMDHILRGYYSIKALNPKGIRPAPPAHISALLATAK